MANVKKENYTISEIRDFEIPVDRNEIFNILKSQEIDDFKKVFAIININELSSQDEAKDLIQYLTDHINPLREATALKIEELNDDTFFLNEFSKQKIVKSIIDINPNICRAMCNFISSNENIALYIEDELIKNIENIIKSIQEYEKEFGDFFDNKIRNTKNHAKNKLLFSFYWSLEVLSCSFSSKNREKIIKIISYAIKFCDYTIREKAVKMLLNIDNPPSELLQIAKTDLNFYVKNQVYVKIGKED